MFNLLTVVWLELGLLDLLGLLVGRLVLLGNRLFSLNLTKIVLKMMDFHKGNYIEHDFLKTVLSEEILNFFWKVPNSIPTFKPIRVVTSQICTFFGKLLNMSYNIFDLERF